MNDKLCELLLKIESLNDKELQTVKTWVEYNICKRDFNNLTTFPNTEK
jgi:hypothetical protein